MPRRCMPVRQLAVRAIVNAQLRACLLSIAPMCGTMLRRSITRTAIRETRGRSAMSDSCHRSAGRATHSVRPRVVTSALRPIAPGSRRALSGKQPEDPSRAAHAILEAIELPNPPHHLLLGNDAHEAAMAKARIPAPGGLRVGRHASRFGCPEGGTGTDGLKATNWRSTTKGVKPRICCRLQLQSRVGARPTESGATGRDRCHSDAVAGEAREAARAA